MNAVRLLLRVLGHPTDTFEDLKHRRQWDMRSSFVLLALWFLSAVFQNQLTDFKFNYRNTEQFNVLYVVASTVVLFAVWTVINWAVAALLDGKGSMKEIWVASAYALTPYIAASFLQMLLSHVLIMDEGMFITIVSAVGFLWSAFLLVDAMRVIHDYSFMRTLGSILLVILGMLFVLFLCVLFLGLIQQVIVFFKTIYVELRLRR